MSQKASAYGSVVPERTQALSPPRRFRSTPWRWRAALAVLAVSSLALLSACGGGSGGGGRTVGEPPPPPASGPTSPPPPAGQPPRTGVLLDGGSESPALGAIVDFNEGAAVSAGELSPDAAGSPVARTVFEIALEPDVTVGQVNTLLQGIDARIVNMVAGLPFVIVRIPDPGTVAGLEAVIAQVEANPEVRFVNRGHLPGTDALPDNVGLTEADLQRIDHHIAVRADRAWNASGALATLLGDQPTLIVADSFGDGSGNADFDVDLVAGTFGSGDAREHGYHVLGILGGRFGGAATDRQQVTGVFPGRLRLGVVDFIVDATTAFTFSGVENEIIKLVRDAPAKSIVSTSLNDCDSGMCDPAKDTFRQRALTWIEKVRTAALEDRFLHVTSSGNIKRATPTHTGAERNSPFAAAALAADLERKLPDGSTERVSNLTNTLVIDNVVPASATPFAPRCLEQSSKFPGSLAGIGSEVHSFLGASAGAGNKSGTSMATPQVAGVATYVWTLNPSLSPQALLGLLQATATASVLTDPAFPPCAATASAPVIDAYAALLAADRASALVAPGVPADAPARLAILDVADGAGNPADDDGTPQGNGVFDEHDLVLLLNQFVSPEARAATAPGFSRYDLNGDGWVDYFAHRVAAFNLDIDYPPAYLTTTLEAVGSRRTLDESQLTDMQVLCYYAYSPVYTGSAAQREFWIAHYCAPLAVTHRTQAMADFLVSPSSGRRCGSTDRLPSTSAPPVALSAACLASGNSVAFTVAQEGAWRLNWDVSAASAYNAEAVPRAFAELDASYTVDGPGTLRVTLLRAWGNVNAPAGVTVGHVTLSIDGGGVLTHALSGSKPVDPLVHDMAITGPRTVRVTLQMNLTSFAFGTSFAGAGPLARIEFFPAPTPS